MRNNRRANKTSFATSAVRHIDATACALGRWAITDHYSNTKQLPGMGFWETIQYIAIHFIFAVFSALVSGVLMFLLIYYGIPLLIDAAMM
jgi:hypothetical protein